MSPILSNETFNHYLQTGDTLTLDSLHDLASDERMLHSRLDQLQEHGVPLHLNHIAQDGGNQLNLLLHAITTYKQLEAQTKRNAQSEGVGTAKRKGAYKGGTVRFKPLSPAFVTALNAYRDGMTVAEIQQKSGMNSRTFLRYRQRLNITSPDELQQMPADFTMDSAIGGYLAPVINEALELLELNNPNLDPFFKTQYGIRFILTACYLLCETWSRPTVRDLIKHTYEVPIGNHPREMLDYPMYQNVMNAFHAIYGTDDPIRVEEYDNSFRRHLKFVWKKENEHDDLLD